MNYAKEHLLYMLQKEAYTPGKFTLASGKETDFYIDCRKVTLTNTGMWLVGRLFCQEIAEIDPKIKAIAGEGVGGSAIALAASMAHSSFIQTILIRKQAKEGKLSAYDLSKSALIGNVLQHQKIASSDVQFKGQLVRDIYLDTQMYGSQTLNIPGFGTNSLNQKYQDIIQKKQVQ
jgi:hypothetical protein